jgi:cyanophycinase-like exopeptidase
MMGDHQKGFGYISNIAIDQHVLARNRQFDMFEVLKAHPGLLGISIDENTAAIVTGDTLQVLGGLIYPCLRREFLVPGRERTEEITCKRVSLLLDPAG